MYMFTPYVWCAPPPLALPSGSATDELVYTFWVSKPVHETYFSMTLLLI